jgi:hypothetical protein
MHTTFIHTRRRHPRIAIDGTRPAQDLTHGHWVQIRNISLGGFLTASPRASSPGDIHTFRGVLRHGESCVLRATAIHCQPAVGTLTTCIIGWQAAADAATAAAMQRLLDDVATTDGAPVTRRSALDWAPDDCA